jgi:4-hydroxy-tetrahydrodipicolinate synthase
MRDVNAIVSTVGYGDYMKSIANGVWPTMITPYSADGTIDYSALEKLIDWYIENGVTGLFAVCQSSEMFHLSLAERLTLARACVKFARGRVPVIASGMWRRAISDQVVDEDSGHGGIPGLTRSPCLKPLCTKEGEKRRCFQTQLRCFLSSFHYDITLGFTNAGHVQAPPLAELVAHCAATGRFGFLKDTSCSMSR